MVLMRRLVHIAGLTVIIAITAGGVSCAAESAVPPTSAPPPQSSSPAPRNWKARLQELHDQLNVNETQKDSWNKLEATLSHNHEIMRQALVEQRQYASTANALDTFSSYQRIAEIHLENIKRVKAAFTDFYGTLSPQQKETADRILKKSTVSTPPRAGRAD